MAVSDTHGNDDDPLVTDLLTSIQALMRQGPRARTTLVQLADRGDWRARVLALGALGALIRDDRTSARRFSLLGRVLARIPGLRRHLRTVGYRGRLVSRGMLNATQDRSFVVRAAAALALGECRDPELVRPLTALLADPFRPVRRAAAIALAACGRPSDVFARIDDDCEPTPAQMAEGVSTLRWLQRLADAHRGLFDAATPPGEPGSRAAERYARWLAGPVHVSGEGGALAEAVRYDHETELTYQLAKPFGSEDRTENLRQLDAFVALASNLDLPRGARILDLGGGSGWVAELLARFGFVPLVVDVAHPLLRLAQRRFSAHTLRGHVVAADVTSLPLLDGSIDAIVAMDALHHVENLAGVFTEARRVLTDGGLFLIAEPGEGHSESPKSLAESREHAVRESEIHPLNIARVAARAGFDRAEALPRIPAQARIDVADLRRAMTQPAEAWRVHHLGSETRFATLALRSMLARPLLIFSAGRRRPDTRAPGVLAAEIRPSVQRVRDTVEGHVEVSNTGDTLWLPHTADGVGAVSLGAQLLDVEGRMINREYWRERLPAAVPPGGSCRILVTLPLPPRAGRCRVKWDLVAERVCWFEDRGSRPAVSEL